MGGMVEKNKIYLSWEDFGNLAEQLKEKIQSSSEVFDGVYGVPRGGLLLAVYLSHYLKLPYIHNTNQITLDTLIADDISDNGKTLEKFKGKNKIACLYKTSWTKIEPNWYLRIKESENDWIVYPWETDEELTEKDNL